MLNITNQQGNENQNHNEISPHTCQNDYYQRQQITGVGEDMEKRKTSCTVGRNVKVCSVGYGESSKITNESTI